MTTRRQVCAACGSGRTAEAASCEACGSTELREEEQAPIARVPVTARRTAALLTTATTHCPPHAPARPSPCSTPDAWPAFKAWFYGLVAGWLVRWVVAIVLLAGRFLHDWSSVGQSSRLWVDIAAVCCGLAVMAVVMWRHMAYHMTATAMRSGALRGGWISMMSFNGVILPAILWCVSAVGILLWHSPDWRARHAMERRHAALVNEAGFWLQRSQAAPPDPQNLLASYRKVLSENPQHRGALQGRDRLAQRLLDHARDCYLGLQLAKAEQILQMMQANGISEDWLQRHRSSWYQCGGISVDGAWSSDLWIGNRFLELVVDGPIQISGGDPATAVLIEDSGSNELEIAAKSIQFRSPTGVRRVDYYLAKERIPGEEARRPPGIRDPIKLIIGALSNRDAPATITINRNAHVPVHRDAGN